MLNDVSDSLKAKLYERINSPLSGAFLLAWFVSNWKVIVALISGNASAPDRIKYISDVLPSDLIHLFFIPLAAALVLVFLYPWPAKLAFWFSEWQRADLARIKNRYESETPLSIEQSRAMRAEIVEQGVIADKEIARLKEENIALRDRLAEKIKPKLEDPAGAGNDESSWTKEFEELDAKGLLEYFKSVLPQLSMGNKAAYHFASPEKLVGLGLAESQGPNGTMRLTEKGKHFAYLITSK